MTEITTLRVSKKTAEALKKQRKAVLEKTFGIDCERIKPFAEGDRGEILL